MSMMVQSGRFAGAGGGGGGGGTYLSTFGSMTESGAGGSILADTTAASKFTTPSGGTCTVMSAWIGLKSTVTAGRKLRLGIYTDSSGIGSLVAQSDEFTTSSLTHDTDVQVTFPSTVTLTGGAAYWIAVLADGTLAYRTGSGAAETRRVSDTYSDGMASSPGAGSVTGDPPLVYMSVAQTTTPTGTGYISDGGLQVTRAAITRAPLPDGRAVGDIALVHVLFQEGGGAPTFAAPAGYTQIDAQALNDFANNRSLIFYRRLDGSDPCPEIYESVATVDILAVVTSIWRGYQATGTPYEAESTSTGSSATPTGTDITTTGANRTVINAYAANGFGAAATFTKASGWSYGYTYTTAVGGDGTMAMTWKDQATAATVTKESATLSASRRWRSFTAALIKA